MSKVPAACFLVTSLIMASATSADGQQKEKKGQPFDGTWLAVGMEKDGTKLPADALEKLAIKLTLNGDAYTVTSAGAVIDSGKCNIDTQKKPSPVDITSDLGQNKGKTTQAIIEVDGENLKACYDLAGKGRPTQFATQKDSGFTLILYKREAKK